MDIGNNKMNIDDAAKVEKHTTRRGDIESHSQQRDISVATSKVSREYLSWDLYRSDDKRAFKMICLPEQKSACLDAALAPVQAALI